jgi:hypothetical protein
LIPSGANFRPEGKKNPLVCLTPKYRFVVIPSHGDMVLLYMGGAGVRGFSQSAREGLLLNEIPGGTSSPRGSNFNMAGLEKDFV